MGAWIEWRQRHQSLAQIYHYNGPAYVARQTVSFARSIGFVRYAQQLLTAQRAMVWQKRL